MASDRGNESPFRPPTQAEEEVLQAKHPVWEWITRGQKKRGNSHGSYRLKCKLCGKEFVGPQSRACFHFTNPSDTARCRGTSGKILHALQQKGAVIPQKLWHLVEDFVWKTSGTKWDHENDDGGNGDDDCDSEEEEEESSDMGCQGQGGAANEAAPTTGRVAVAAAAAADEGNRGNKDHGAGTHGGGFTVVGNNDEPVEKKITPEEYQKNVHMATARFFYACGIPFRTVLHFTFQKLHEVYMVLVDDEYKIPPPTYEALATSLLDAVKAELEERVAALRSSWKMACSFLTNGTTSTTSIMNFVLGGETGMFLLKTQDMSKLRLPPVVLAKEWAHTISEVGPHLIDAIVTDFGLVNVDAAKLLSLSEDQAISSIPWVPCAVDWCNLLLNDLHSDLWLETVILEARDITIFVKTHGRPLAMMREIEGCKDLIKPDDVVYGVDLLNLKKLQEMRWVLHKLVSSQKWKLTPWTDRLLESAQRMFHLVRDSAWWERVQQVVNLLKPINDLMKMLDTDARRGSKVWETGRILEQRVDALQAPADVKARLVDAIKSRVGMIMTPAYGAAYLLDPKNRDGGGIKSFPQSAIENAVLYLERVCGGRQSEEFVAAFASLPVFHRRDPSASDAWGGKQGDLDASNADIHGTTWWAKHGNDHPALQKVAIRALNTWSIASPCERKWVPQPSFILREWKRKMPWSTLEKLIYVHWNLRLLYVREHEYGNVYPWGDDVDVAEDETQGEGCLDRGQLNPEEAEAQAKGWSKKPNNGKWRPCAPPKASDSWDFEDDVDETESDWLQSGLCCRYQPIVYYSEDDWDFRDAGSDRENLDNHDDDDDAPGGSSRMLPLSTSVRDRVPPAAEVRTDYTPQATPRENASPGSKRVTFAESAKEKDGPGNEDAGMRGGDRIPVEESRKLAGQESDAGQQMPLKEGSRRDVKAGTRKAKEQPAGAKSTEGNGAEQQSREEGTAASVRKKRKEGGKAKGHKKKT
ncbi:hypothetical protein CBR_g4846 [Chara braunii]|uniref:DUF659 domain-containing protein n=1 Tax=Chara braunii TaxID=69332 RepID=A0A388KJ07_CHABU|nr:hypothetical protein CBR_g4846 [Chara braunii]|eukprot:GBG70019.1 hypothetical protein CBR_g4846 [Chara braunii]